MSSIPFKKIKIESEKETAIFRSMYLGYFKDILEENEKLKKENSSLRHLQSALNKWNDHSDRVMCNFCLDNGSLHSDEDVFDECDVCSKDFCVECMWDVTIGFSSIPQTFRVCILCKSGDSDEMTQQLYDKYINPKTDELHDVVQLQREEEVQPTQETKK